MITLLTLAFAADPQRVPASSTGLDAVVVIPEEGPSRLLVADATTSAPVALSSATLTLSGPAQVNATFTPEPTPGHHRGELALERPGDYAGALVTDQGGKADLLSITGLSWLPAVETSHGESHLLPWILGGIAALAAALVGYAAGRRAAPAAALLTLGVAHQVHAHGGEDHGAPAAPTPAGSAITLKLESQFLVGLRTERVGKVNFQPRIWVPGVLGAAPGGAATLAAPVAGTLSAPPGGFPRPGQAVKAGQILAFVLDAAGASERAALAAARAEAAVRVAQAEAALSLAERDAAQVETLGAALAPRERLERENALATARAELEAAREALARTGAMSTPVSAPVDGVLGLATARPGDLIQAGEPLFRVVGEGALWVQAELPAGAPDVAVGAAAELGLPGGGARTATVTAVAPELDPRRGTRAVSLVLAAEPGLLPGTPVDLWLPVGESEPALSIPDEAVLDANGVALAFVKTGPESFSPRELQLGSRGAGSWEVHGGLAEGERVVTEGSSALRAMAGR